MVMYMNSAQECEDVRHVVTSGWQEQHDDHHDVVCISWDLTGSPPDTDLTCCLLSVVGKVETLTVSICLLALCGLHSQVLPPDGRNSRERRRPHPNTESSADRIGLTFIFFPSSLFYVYSAQNQRCNLCGRRRQNLSQGPAPRWHPRAWVTNVCLQPQKYNIGLPLVLRTSCYFPLNFDWPMTSQATKTHCQNTTSSTGSWTMGKIGVTREKPCSCVTQLLTGNDNFLWTSV